MAPSKKGKPGSKQDKALEKLKRKEEKKKKQELKTEKSQKKKESKELEGEEDIQTTISKIEKAKKARLATPSGSAIVACPQPGPRSAFSIVQSPISDELILYGGQYYDGQIQYVYGETYRWNFGKNEWRMVETSPSPNPRSCHQAVVHKHHMYIFGGEFSTLRQFYHYRDMWRFDMKTNTWEEVKGSGTPPTQRSGHRMIVWKQFIVVFGGFHDTFRDCKYFNDLHVFNISEEKWIKVDVSEISVPSPRSGCGFFLHPTNDTAFVYGGYVRDKKASGSDLNDMWQLSLRVQTGVTCPVKATWERLSRKGTPPTRRSGASFAVHKNRALVFGGVFDKDNQGLTMESEFFNELYAFDMDRKRWYVLEYSEKIKKKGVKRALKNRMMDPSSKIDQMSSDDEETEVADEDSTGFGQFQWVFEYTDENGQNVQMVVTDEDQKAEGNLPEVQQDHQQEELQRMMVQSPTPTSLSQSSSRAASPMAPSIVLATKPAMELPPSRMGASLFVLNNTLAIYGGISEIKDKEVTYDDCWSLDLNARDRWVKKLEGTMHLQQWRGDDEDDEFDEEMGSDEDYSDGDSMDEDSDDDSDDSSGSDSEGSSSSEEEAVIPTPVIKKSLKGKMEQIREKHDLNHNYTPLVGESLKDFFARTCDHWMKGVVDAGMEQSSDRRFDINDKKEIRKRAFAVAGDRFAATASVLAKLAEYEQQQAADETKAARPAHKKDKK